MFLSVISGDKDSLCKFLDDGADPNVRDMNGNTLLMFACDKSSFELVQTLLEAGAKPNMRNVEGVNSTKTQTGELQIRKNVLRQH